LTSIGRRGFIGGIAALIAAPAIVRASSIMPVRSFAGALSLEEYSVRLLTPTSDALLAEARKRFDRANQYALENRRDAAEYYVRLSEMEWSRSDLPRVGDTLRIRVPEKFQVLPFGFRTPADNQGEIHGLVMSTSGDRDLLRANRGDALNA